LDAAIANGGANLTAAILGASGKAAANILQELCDQGHLAKSSGKSPKYSITPEGRQTWENEASLERKEEIKTRAEQQRKNQLVSVLILVQGKEGRALTATEDKMHNETLKAALEANLIAAEKKTRTYSLTDAGEEMLDAQRPLDEQLQHLHQLLKELGKRWRIACETLAEQLKFLGQASLDFMNPIFANSDKHFGELETQYTNLVGGNAVVALSAAARAVLHKEQAQVKQAQSQMQAELAQQRRDNEAFETRVAQSISELSRQAKPTTQPPQEPPPKVVIDGAAVWETTKAAHAKIRLAYLSVGGSVNVPELTEEVRKTLPALSVGEFHNLLQTWQGEDKLTLQVCNDPRREPRASEGIQSPRGLLFYVQMR
jgi:predicted transcriptional regulator